MPDVTDAAAAMWGQVCTFIREKVSEELFVQWFSKVTALELDGTRLLLGTPDDFFASWVQDHYIDYIRDALDAVGASEGLKIEFESGHVPAKQDEAEEQIFEKSAVIHSFEKEEDPSFVPVENCLSRYTFETFVVGEENRYAYTAATTAARQPGVFNPLYIYGGPGMGKTHLIQAVANDVKKHRRNVKVRYATCEDLLNDYVSAMHNSSEFGFPEFRKKYREVDLLLIDDVHHLSGKPALQQEFFNTFNALYNSGSQIILTSDKQPSEIVGLEERLVSRFESGVTTQITPPSFETRLAILEQEQKNQNPKLGREILELIAQRISSNVRPLIGALACLMIYSQATNEAITPVTAERVLSDFFDKEAETRKVSIDAIQKVVASYFDIHVHDLTGPKKPKNIAEPRMIAMYLSRKLTNHSQNEIGLAFGGRSHATVIHAVKQIEDACVKDEAMKRTISTIQRQLQTNISAKTAVESV